MNELFEEKEFLQKIFLSSPQAMILFDAGANAIFKNKDAEALPGHIFSLAIKDSIKEIMASEASYKQRNTYKYMGEDREKEVAVLISGSVLSYKENKYVLMVIQDLAEIMEANGVVRVCSNCKKVKRIEHSWQDIEVYIKDNLSNVQFSHCICPDCSKKLYKAK
ncbi:MAG: PAS domain S-box protein [Elusimicrobia bacterium]|nr:PAS domain S-box protein [Elusimicrobiota bacterium]